MSSKSRHHRSSSSKHRPKRISAEAIGSSDTDLSFYFVVNELTITGPLDADQWGTPIPSTSPNSVGGETAGTVFRYSNGGIHNVSGIMYWDRRDTNLPGRITYRSEEIGQDNVTPVTAYRELGEYQTCTLFDCGPFLPCIFANGDATVNALTDPSFRYWALHFSHDGGVSRAASGPHKVVAGSHPSWLGTLVHTIYKNHMENAPQSEGLGGELGLVLGLMALTQRPGYASRAFRHWNNHRWTGRREAGIPQSGPPRGVLVHVALDPTQNPDHAWTNLQAFEQYGVAVEEG
ncbi:hypothetical protein DL765_009475 [Monosporascus sp. GIB2]|nr:hypothetical protein DL765_009475 [Monosporascus sp. GIB2]